jgi:hypothetical protein
MKYLKIFETFGEYYFEIGYPEYCSSIKNLEELTEKQLFSIKDKIESKGWEFFHYLNIFMHETKDFKKVCRIDFLKDDEFYYKRLRLIVNKGTDDWFYIQRIRPLGNSESEFKYYKADQLEGLEKFIDEVL